MADVFRDICLTECQENGLMFMVDTISVEDIREDQSYDGIRVHTQSQLAETHIQVQVDINSGDTVVPEPAISQFPPIFKMPFPKQ